jgi:AP-3 complex subunit delta
LTPHEPRLVKKLQAPLTELISTTSAISLLYECVQTCIIGGMLRGSSGDALARMCVSKLSAFIQNEDQNRACSFVHPILPNENLGLSVKYYALFAMQKIVPSHSHLIAEYQDMIMESINDEDTSIAMRALDLVSTMVTIIAFLFFFSSAAHEVSG